MRRFATKTVIFLVPLITMVIYLEAELKMIPNTYDTKRRFLEGSLEEIEVLVTGMSHSVAVNPKYLSRKGFNLSNGSQDLYYDTQLILKYLEAMKNLRLVIIPISCFSLEYQLIFSPEKWRTFFYFRYFKIPFSKSVSILDLRRYSFFALYGPETTLFWAMKGFKVEVDIDENGWPKLANVGNKNVVINNSEGVKRVRLHESMMDRKNIDGNLKLLGDIFQRLQAKNIQIVLITMPVFRTYSDNVDHRRYWRCQEIIKGICEKYNIKYFNYFCDDRFTINDFSNNDHVNAQGAEKFSKIVNEEIIERIFKN